MQSFKHTQAPTRGTVSGTPRTCRRRRLWVSPRITRHVASLHSEAPPACAKHFHVDMATQRADGDLWLSVKQTRRSLPDSNSRNALRFSCGAVGAPVARSCASGSLWRKEGEQHIRVAAGAYRHQLEMGKRFLHEHPAGVPPGTSSVQQGSSGDWRFVQVGGGSKQRSEEDDADVIVSCAGPDPLERCLAEVQPQTPRLDGQHTALASVFLPKLVVAVLKALLEQMVAQRNKQGRGGFCWASTR